MQKMSSLLSLAGTPSFARSTSGFARAVLRVQSSLRSRAGRIFASASSSSSSSSSFQPSSLIVAGIETSCDDTAVGIIEAPLASPTSESDGGRGGGRVLANVIGSQFSLHGQYGGVVPHLASAAHSLALPSVWERAQEMAACKDKEGKQGGTQGRVVDAIAVTVGPGLAVCLDAGLQFARAKALELAKQTCSRDLVVIPVHHLEAHLLLPRLIYGTQNLSFPFLVLLVSGGHTLVALARGVGNHVVLGSTMDDSCGECLDKVARLLKVWRYNTEDDHNHNHDHSHGEASSTATPSPSFVQEASSLISAPGDQDGTSAIVKVATWDKNKGRAVAFRTLLDAANEARKKVQGQDEEDEQDLLAETTDDIAALSSLKGHLAAHLEALAKSGNEDRVKFPIPLKGPGTARRRFLLRQKAQAPDSPVERKPEVVDVCRFSFSGLKSSAARHISTVLESKRRRLGLDGRSPTPTPTPTLTPPVSLSFEEASDIAASFQKAVAVHLADQLRKALDHCYDDASPSASFPSHLVVVGGVAANHYLRGRIEQSLLDWQKDKQKELDRKRKGDTAAAASPSLSPPVPAPSVSALFPPGNLCTDNGVMVAWAGAEAVMEALREPKEPSSLSSEASRSFIEALRSKAAAADDRCLNTAQQGRQRRGFFFADELVTVLGAANGQRGSGERKDGAEGGLLDAVRPRWPLGGL